MAITVRMRLRCDHWHKTQCQSVATIDCEVQPQINGFIYAMDRSVIEAELPDGWTFGAGLHPMRCPKHVGMP